jgi:hypothetical protein
MWASSWFGYNWVSLFNSEIFMGVKARHHTSKGFIKTSERKQNYLGIIMWWKLNYRKSVNHRSRSTIQKGGSRKTLLSSMYILFNGPHCIIVHSTHWTWCVCITLIYYARAISERVSQSAFQTCMLVITKLPNTQTYEIVIPTRPIAYLYLLVSSIQRGSICNYCEP